MKPLRGFIFARREKRKSLSGAKGFTLVELLLVIGIVWVIAAGASTPFLSVFLSSRQADTVATEVVRTLRKAQGYALSGKGDSAWGVHYDAGADTLTLFKGTSFVGRNPVFDEDTDISPAVSVENFSDVYFGKLRGEPSTTLSVTVSSGGEEITVSLNGEGRVDVQ